MVEPHKMVLDFARPSRPLSDAEVAKCEKMCEVITEFLKLRREAFIRDRQQQPLLEVYSSDCTPANSCTI